ncbi:hypothetical protein SAMN05421823_11547 [Catalinimonas alkaloidigena]|uniref:Large polyvalent protein associated domain-containing protein n=1 Tax=Catalinimonas alkaloidigena TaxID=1075417 RepID=A0A1G9U0C8_9BACT|nr:hypothetical protein [Catalinimonas alkaloidigena]SDM53338.1 hypothetical protein SAMN05421823_11547 [Catalinimonas alkaloidigena]
MLQNQAIADYAEQIARNPDIKISRTERKGYTQLKAGNRPIYGALTNKWSPNFIAEDFKGFFYGNELMNTLYDAFRIYDRTQLRQFLKRYYTIFSPIVQLGNATGNYAFAFLAGIDPLSLSSHLPEAIRQVRGQGTEYMELVKSGIVQSDVVTADLLPLSGHARNVLTKTQEAKNTLRSTAEKADKAIADLYQGSDDVAKLSAYIALTRDYRYKPDKAKELVYRAFQNYATVGKAYDFASKTPIVGNPYVKFVADLARILKNATTTRPLSTMMFLMLLRGVADLASELSGEAEENKKEREARKFIPKIKLPVELPYVGNEIPLLWQTKWGEVNVARFLSPYYLYDRGDAGSAVEDFTKFMPYQLQSTDTQTPGIETLMPEFSDVLLGPLVSLAFDKDFRGKSIRDPEGNRFRSSGATTEEQALNAVNYIARSYIPLFPSAQDMYNAYQGNPDYYGRERSLSQAILNNFIKVQEFGDKQLQETATRDIEYLVSRFEQFNRQISTINNQAKAEAVEIRNGKGDTATKKRRLDELLQRRNKRIADQLTEQAEVVKELEEKVRAYRYDRRNIGEAIRQAGKEAERRGWALEADPN